MEKKLALSFHHVSCLRGMRTSDGMFPFYLPLGVKVRFDGTLRHLPPLTKRMTRILSTNTHEISPIKVHNAQKDAQSHFFSLLISCLVFRTNSGIGVLSADGS